MTPFILIFAILIGTIIALLIIRNPFTGLLIFTVMIFIPPAALFPQLAFLHITRIIAAFTFIVVLLKKPHPDKSREKISVQTKLFLAFIIVMFFSITTSIWRANTLTTCLSFSKVFIAYILILKLVKSTKQLKSIIGTMLFSGIFIAIVSIKDYSGMGRLSAFGDSMFSNTNDLALCFVILIPFAFYGLFQKGNILKKSVLLGSIALYLEGIFLTASRGAFVGCAIMLFFIIFQSKRKILNLFCGALIAFLIFNLVPVDFKNRIATIPTAASDDGNTITRIDAWEAGASMMKNRAFGVGLGNFGEGFFRYRPYDAIDVAGKRRAAHNVFVQVGGELGLPGLLIFIALIISSLKSLSRTKKRLLSLKSKNKNAIINLINATSISLISFCATAFFLSQAYNWILYYLIAFSVIIERLAKEES